MTDASQNSRIIPTAFDCLILATRGEPHVLTYRSLRPFAHSTLADLADSAARALGTDANRFGGHVWLIPRRYHRARTRNQQNVLVYAELTKRLIARPRMYQAACVRGPVTRRSGVNWVVGKGFLGRLLSPACSDYEILQHESFWPPDIETMTDIEWTELNPAVREGRSLEDARRLRRIYGTALGASIPHAESGHPIGCITLHTGRGDSLSEFEARKCAELLVVQARRLGQTISSELRK